MKKSELRKIIREELNEVGKSEYFEAFEMAIRKLMKEFNLKTKSDLEGAISKYISKSIKP